MIPGVKQCSAAGISKARNLFERAITAAGLHVAEGNRIWEMYRDFEQAIILTFHETDNEAWETERGTVDDGDLDGLPSNVVAAYQKALEMLNACMLLEEQISRMDLADLEKLQQYMTSLKFEQSSGDPARVQILFERAITEFPISSDLWLEYTRYLDKIFKASKIVRDVYYRATRNCPWVGELWVRYLLCLERGRASEEEISTVFEKSLLCSVSSYDEYLDIFLTRVDGLRRRMSVAGKEEALDYAVIRDTFQDMCHSWVHFEREYGSLEDFDLAVQKV